MYLSYWKVTNHYYLLQISYTEKEIKNLIMSQAKPYVLYRNGTKEGMILIQTLLKICINIKKCNAVSGR